MNTRANAEQGGCERVHRGPAFTLIEMLTVIAVIGLLASMVVGVGPMVGRKMREGRIRAELTKMVMAIEGYKADFGQYPPDHRVLPEGGPVAVDSVNNTLFFELTGCVVDNANSSFLVPRYGLTNTAATLKTFFNADGIVNSKTDEKELRRPYLQFTEKQYRLIDPNPTNTMDVYVLVAPVPWPLNRSDQPTPIKGVNPWHYVSTNPTNNPNGFDLWAEWVEGRKVKVLSNWAKDAQDRE